MTKLFTLLLLLACSGSFSQAINEKLIAGIKSLEADSQCRHGIISLYVVDSKTGREVFSRNASVGLAPASCQKIITSATAFELLGHNFTYNTTLSYAGTIVNTVLQGDIIISGSGDPTLCSWRYQKTKEEVVLTDFLSAINKTGIREIRGKVLAGKNPWGTQSIPGGWVWDDIGNYYGAGASALNWRENQYDLALRSSKKIGDTVKIVSTVPSFLHGVTLINEVTSAGAGSGDNTIIYLPENAGNGYIRGTIPVNEDHFVVAGSFPNPALQLTATLYHSLHADNLHSEGNVSNKLVLPSPVVFFTHTSPPLDSINYWFLKKSINLYGEALLKTIAYNKTGHGSTDTGVNIVKDFWKKYGIDAASLNIIDGSGLSPANRVTAMAITNVLQYAHNQSWFGSFYNALPEINGIKMKSGSINGVLSYAGYIKNKDGQEFTFTFIINNFNGSGAALKTKMWRLLDILK